MLGQEPSSPPGRGTAAALGKGILPCGAGLSWVTGEGRSWGCELVEERHEGQVCSNGKLLLRVPPFQFWGEMIFFFFFFLSELLHRVTACSLEGTSNGIKGYLYLVLGGESFLELLPRILVRHPIIQLEVPSREHIIISYL